MALNNNHSLNRKRIVNEHNILIFEPRPLRGVLDTLCDTIYERLATGRWLSLDTPVFSTNKTDRHDITEILLKVALNTISLNLLKLH